MTISKFVMGLAALLLTLVLGIYLFQIIQGSSTPNPITWGVGCVLAWVNALTYKTLSKGEILKTLMAYIPAIGLLAIVGYSILYGKFTYLGAWDYATMGMVFLLVILWKKTSNDSLANVCSQGVSLISFIPTITGLLEGKAVEDTLPWALALTSYALMTMIVIKDSKRDLETLVKLAYPVSRILTNGAVIIATVI